MAPLTPDRELGPGRLVTLLRQRMSVLLVARLVEQGLLAVMLIVLARRLGPDSFAPVSVLFIVNSLSVTASDFGLGLDLLRLPIGRALSLSSLRRIRTVNTSVAVIGLAVGAAIGGDVGAVIATGGLIWLFSAEAYVRASGALRRGRAEATARADIIGTSAAAIVVLVAGTGPAVVLLTGSALAAKHLIGAMCLRDWRTDFAEDGEVPRPIATWYTQLLAFATSNVDYLIGGIVLGPEFLSIYLVAFRLSNAAPSQVAAVTSRVAVADLAAVGAAGRESVYRRLTSRVGAVGLLAGLATAAIAPLLPLLLGGSWSAVAPTTLVLATAVPARLLMGIAGALALSSGRVRLLATIESIRLVATAAMLLTGGLLGESQFVVAAATATIVATVLLHAVTTRAAGIALPRWAWPLAATLTVLAISCGMVVG